MIYAVELFSDAIAEVEPLAIEHYHEVASVLEGFDKPVAFELDIEGYRALEAAGVLRCYTARNGDGLLIGYASFIVAPSNLHHKGLIYAANDTLYVAREWRGVIGRELIRFAEQDLSRHGVRLSALSVPVANDWSLLAERWGYRRTETQMQKWIGG